MNKNAYSIKDLLSSFSENLLVRLEQAYNDEVFTLLSGLPQPVVRFNNTEALKRAQLYVRHTNRLFSKAFARLIAEMFNSIGQQAVTCKDTKGDCVLNKTLRIRFHFMNLETIAGFPNVPWFKSMAKNNVEVVSNNVKDDYILLLRLDKRGEDYCSMIKKATEIIPYSFYSLDDFVHNHFGDDTLSQLMDTFHFIEQKTSSFEWFELAKTCNNANLEVFKQTINEELVKTDYLQLLRLTNSFIDQSSFRIIHNSFLNSGRYLLLTGESDYAKSFYSSEWLFTANKKDSLLDKTFIIAGYIKSVEQLLSRIVQSQSADHKIYVQRSEGFVRVQAGSRESLSATLGNMVYFIKSIDNKDIFSEGINRKAISSISSIIQDWIKNERNGYFHKHNIDSFDKVEQVRKSTILIHFLLLGSVKCIK